MTRLSDDQLARLRERNEQARQMVSALCQPQGTAGARRWTMSIPARPDHDPDLVIGRALGDEKLLLDALTAGLDDLREFLFSRIADIDATSARIASGASGSLGDLNLVDAYASGKLAGKKAAYRMVLIELNRIVPLEKGTPSE